MARTLLDNITPLTWDPDQFTAMDSDEPKIWVARCNLARMSFRVVQGKNMVRGTFKSSHDRTDGKFVDMDAAKDAANTVRREELVRLMVQPAADINIAPVKWSPRPDDMNTLTATCPITNTTFSITRTDQGYAGTWPDAPLVPVASANSLRDAVETWRKEQILPHITTGPVPAPESIEIDLDPVVWITRDGEELRMREIEDGHLENIIRHLTDRKDAAEADASFSGGAILSILTVEVERMTAQLSGFTAEAERRGLSDTLDEIPF